MRLFDFIGAAAVAGWLGLIGFYVWHTYFADEAEDIGSGVVIREGESWMLLTREDEEVGYIHETRTRLDDELGWLLEYDLLMNVSMLGVNQFIKTNIKASVDTSAYLKQFNATIEAASTQFKMEGRVEGTTVTMSMDLAGQLREQKLELKEAPRLSNSAVNALVAAEKLTPGQRFEQQYFDPTVLGMTTMTFEYVREHEVAVFDQKIPTRHFRQIVAGNELDVYVDDNGEVYIQEFPFRIIGARVPNELGQSRASAMKREFRDKKDSVDLSVETAVGLLKGVDQVFSKNNSEFLISDIPEGVILSLDSGEQRAVQKKAVQAIVDTAQKGEREELTTDGEAKLLESSLRIDHKSGAFAELLPDEQKDKTSTLRAETLARALRDRMKNKGEVSIQTASQALEKGEGDCTELSLVLVAALRHHGIPARFVSGVRESEGKLIPHQWVQYWNGGEYIDIDLTTDTLMPGTNQIQLFTHTEPEHPEYVHVLDQIKIEPVAEPGENTAGTPSDFN